MKKAFRILIIIPVLLGLSGFFYFYNNRLFLWEAQILWSQRPFDPVKFKNGSAQERAKMVVSLIDSNFLIDLDADSVSHFLGEENGDYYHDDSNTTYRLTEYGEADWILTITTDGQGKVDRLFIRKSCCSVSRKALNLLIEAFLVFEPMCPVWTREKLVGETGFEPATLWSQTRCATRLRYSPNKDRENRFAGARSQTCSA
jgi:hypothetical protein